MNDQERRANAIDTGANYHPPANTPAQTITPTPEAIAARDLLDKAMPDLTGDALLAAQRQRKAI
ncbi:MAG TPA: hypothetical protein VKV17_17865 [Bryobacteraceae bacterium]|nr:hypothetical protein [Bryobacteraceae bacterium]